MTQTNSGKAGQTALLVVDVQESFRHRPYWSDKDILPFTNRLQALIDGCVERGIAVVQVLHVEEDGAFARESGWVRTLEGIRIAPDVVIEKHYHSALAGTSLGVWLTKRGIRRLIVSGLRTEQCCETTTRHASDSGFTVDYITEATWTFPMQHARTGRVYTVEELKERTELVLEGRFARVKTVEQVLAEFVPESEAAVLRA